MTFNFDGLGTSSTEASLAPVGANPPPAHVDVPASPTELDETRRVLLVGQPNVGKSVIFGALTGTYVTVSNYPGTTVEVTRGRARVGDGIWEVVDTPGTHNLVPMSEDETVARDILVSEHYDALVQVGDAKNLTRTLLLSLQLAELGVPFCLELNMLDEATARGIAIDRRALEDELRGVIVRLSTATEGIGLGDLREYLATQASGRPIEPTLAPLGCAPTFPADVEVAISDICAHLEPSLPVAKRAVATMLLAGKRGLAGWLATHVNDAALRVARERADTLAKSHGVPVFALLSRHRLTRAQAIVRRVQSRGAVTGEGGQTRPLPWKQSIAIAAFGSLVAASAYDGALVRTRVSSAVDPLSSYGAGNVIGRLFPGDVLHGWSAGALALFGVGSALAAAMLHRHPRARTGIFKLVASFVVGWTAYTVAALVELLGRHSYTSLPVHLGAAAGMTALALAALLGGSYDAKLSQLLGRGATHRVWGLPILAFVLLLAYKVVGVFGAGTAVDFVENRLFGSVAAQASLDIATPRGPGEALAPLQPHAGQPPVEAVDIDDGAADGTERLVVRVAGPSRVRVTTETKAQGLYSPDPKARIDVYARGASVSSVDGAVFVEGPLRGAEARVWTGYINRLAFGFFAWIGVPLLTAFFVGPYGLITMGATYAVAIVLPVVATFFFVFSLLEDSGYLPRLAVMANRGLRGMGLNGRAVLPMVLGLGCDTMATLTARILETRKERMLVTLLLALGIPCSSQLSVVFALMQRTSPTATFVWMAVVVATLLGVGWTAARVLPGETSDFLLEMPPIRQPMVRNLVAKTLARIEWYLKEAVPLFLAGTALLFVLDATHMLVYVHRIGEPVVHHLLGFPREAGVADRVSEDLLVGFLRRDFGAAGLLDLARKGRLTAADVAVSMVTITLFIPCIANVFMMAKERGWKIAAAMSAFIFPYALAVGAAVRAGFRLFGG